MAQALGARVVLVTGVHPGYDRSVFTGLQVFEAPSASNPRFANSYDNFGNRTQHMLDPGEPLDSVDWAALPPADVFIVAPSYQEFRRMPVLGAKVVAVSLQGALRVTSGNGLVETVADPVAAATPLCPPGTLVFFSEEDTHRPESLAAALAARGATVVVTRGYRGASLYRGHFAEPYAAIPTVRIVDPTGAGDCFSTTFVVRYAESGDIEEAMRFALAAGALAVEGDGLAGIPSRRAIEDRLREVAA